jgi:hypothetical protein
MDAKNFLRVPMCTYDEWIKETINRLKEKMIYNQSTTK